MQQQETKPKKHSQEMREYWRECKQRERARKAKEDNKN
jgi:hypothetical protein